MWPAEIVRPSEPSEAPPARWHGRGAGVAGVVGVAARLTLGAVLLVAGGLKVTSPAVSARAVQAFQILPYEVASYVGYALPVVEILIGALLIAGLFTREAAIAGGILMLVFTGGIISAWVRGISIDCGCFGGGGAVGATQTQYLPDVVRDLGLAACAGWLVVRPHTRWSVQSRLFPV